MRLSECLNNADITTLRKIADRYGVACVKHSKLSLHQEILLQFRRKAFLEEKLEQWVHGREVGLLRLCLEPNQPVTREDLNGWFGKGNFDLDEILSEGWLFETTRIGGGRKLYCVPDDLRTRMTTAVVQRFLQGVRTSPEGPLVFADEGDSIVRDLDSFLQYTANHEVTLTNEGAMYKRCLDKVLALMQLEEEPLAGGWRFGYGRRFHDYPDRFAFIYDFAYAQGLIEEGQDAKLYITDAWAKWNATRLLERHRACVQYYLRTYRRAIFKLPALLKLLAHTREWTHAQDMMTAADALLNEYYYDSKENVWWTRVLKMLQHLGVLRVGQDELQQTWFQMTNLGQQLLAQDASDTADQEAGQKQVLIVQPNFDIVVTEDVPQVTAELSLFADLKQSGALRIYRLTPHTAERAFAAGKSSQDLVDFLNDYAQTPVPGNVERTVLTWASEGLRDGSIPS